jgi:hypothetical protein
MASKKSIWYHIGHALERARRAPDPERKVAGLGERRSGGERLPTRTPERQPIPSADDLMAAGVAVVVDRMLAGWTGRKAPGVWHLLRAGAAGATAAILVDLVRPLLNEDATFSALDRETADRVLAGVGQGLVYGAVVEPRIPGPALMKGAVYGSAEYATDTVGGLASLLGAHTPQRRMPFLGDVLEGVDPHDRAYLEHLIFGITLALLYESKPSSNGIRPEGE